MKYKLVCIDIDGTLLDDESRLREPVKKCIKRVSDQGVKIVLASGRMPYAVELIEKELGVECIKICNAGTYILMGEQCIYEEYLSNTTMREMYELYAKKNSIPMWIFRDRDWYVTDVDEMVEWEISIIQYLPEIVEMEQLTKQWEKECKFPNKLLLAADKEKIEAICLKMKTHAWEDVDMARSADKFVEIFPKGTNKGKALKAVCRKLNIRPEETIAIGDQELDIPMIETAGIGIAMGNAIAELKEKADFVTRTNNEAGVVYALEQYLM